MNPKLKFEHEIGQVVLKTIEMLKTLNKYFTRTY